MPAFDQLKPFAFSGIAFPFTSYRIVGGLREHVHEYPHSPGGRGEKLGRKLYEVTVQAEFFAGAIVARYGTLWPDGLYALRRLFEAETSADLYVPTVGTFKAYALSWSEEARNTKRNGVTVDMSFREEQEQAFLMNSVVSVDRAGLQAQLESWDNARAQVNADQLRQSSTDLFDGITQAANGLLAIKDQIDLYGSLVASKIETLAVLCDQADRQVKELDTLEFQNARDALHDLWLSATQLQRDAQTKLAELRVYTTPMRMTINAAARAVGIENPADMMQLNAIPDPLDIAAGTPLRYYLAA